MLFALPIFFYFMSFLKKENQNILGNYDTSVQERHTVNCQIRTCSFSNWKEKLREIIYFSKYKKSKVLGLM